MMFTPKNIVQDLSKTSSKTRGTSLVTLYVPSNTNLNQVTSKLTCELSTSQNIKDKSVRYNVQSALKSGLHKIKSYPEYKAPENGFVLCAGEINSWV